MSKAPDKIYLHEGALGSPCTSYRKTTNEDIEYIRKDLIEHIIGGALGPQEALNKIRSL